jgi:hypothetical protein
VVAVQEADYRGDLARLRSIAADMKPYTSHPSLAPAARYWRGFAHWRHALNSLAEAPPDSVDRDFEAAIVEFRQALAINPADIERRSVSPPAWATAPTSMRERPSGFRHS